MHGLRTRFASKGSGVRVPLAPPGKTPSPKIAGGPVVATVCSNGSALALVEQAMQLGERITPGRFIDVRIDLQRGADPAVPEDGLGVASRYVQVLEERGDHMPQVVDLDRPELVGVTDTAEGPNQVARLDRTLLISGGQDGCESHVRHRAGHIGRVCKQGVRGSSPLSSTPRYPQVTGQPNSLSVDLHEASLRRRARCVPDRLPVLRPAWRHHLCDLRTVIAHT
jgi:hypothetical protein